MDILSGDGLRAQVGLAVMVAEHRQMTTRRGDLDGFDARERGKGRRRREAARLVRLRGTQPYDKEQQHDESIHGRHGVYP